MFLCFDEQKAMPWVDAGGGVWSMEMEIQWVKGVPFWKLYLNYNDL